MLLYQQLFSLLEQPTDATVLNALMDMDSFSLNSPQTP